MAVAQQRPLRGYEPLIAKATGVTDVDTIEEIEETMRVRFGTLDALSREDFRDEARFALVAVTVMRGTGEI